MNPIYKQLKKMKLKRNPFKKVNIMLILLCLSLLILGYCMYQMNVFEGLDFTEIVSLNGVAKCSDESSGKYDNMTREDCDKFVDEYSGKTYNSKTLIKGDYYPSPKGNGKNNSNEANEPYGCYVNTLSIPIPLGKPVTFNDIRYSEKNNSNKLKNFAGFVLCKKRKQQLNDTNIESKMTSIVGKKRRDLLKEVQPSNNVQVNKNANDISQVTKTSMKNNIDVALNKGNIALNKGNIVSNDVEIATNTGNITKNTTGIGKNTTDIASMSSTYLKKDVLQGELASYTLTDEQKEPIIKSVYTKINDDITKTLGDWAAFLNGSSVTQVTPVL